MRIERRSFLKLGAAAAIPSVPVSGFAQTPNREPGESTHVKFTSDGLALTPREHAQLLGRLVEERNVAPDSYAIGGVVEELEQTCATLLKKERAIYMPTGTLANHLAVRALAPDGRVAVQEISHLYQDTGDCVQTLSNRPMMPLAPGKATFSPDDLETLLSGTQTGRVKTSVSVVSIETPVRRANGEIFDAAAMDAVIRIARRNGTRLHLDGARLFIQAAYTGKDVSLYAEPFDTVYVSLYKYFNAPAGAILAGPRRLLDDMYHTRRMFGGSLAEAWPSALIALHYANGFNERFTKAVAAAKPLIAALESNPRFKVTHSPNGTNIFRLEVPGTPPDAFRAALIKRGVELLMPTVTGRFTLVVNETLLRRHPADLLDAFVAALS